jgi:hypothetical protein
MGFFNFLISKTFFKHLAIAVVVAVVVFWAILKILGIYTSHGESLAVPDLTGVNYNDIDRIEGAGQFEYLLIDSV